MGVATGDWERVKQELGFYRVTSYQFNLVLSKIESLEFASLGVLVQSACNPVEFPAGICAC